MDPASFFRGLADLPRGGLAILGDPPLRRLALMPVFLTALLQITGFVVLLFFVDDIAALIWKPPDGGWLVPLYWLFMLVTGLLSLAVLFLLLTFVARTASSHFLSRITLRLREKMEGDSLPEGPGGLHADLVYPVWLEIRLLLLVLAVQVPCFAGQIMIPGASFLVAPLQFLLSAFLAALSFLDHPMETEGLPGFSGRLRYGLTHFFRTLGFGTSLLLLLPIPFLGFLLLPAASAGAVIFYGEERIRSTASDNPSST